MPEKTLEATFDHGADRAATPSPAPTPRRNQVLDAPRRARRLLRRRHQVLENEGVEKFIVSWNELLDTVDRGAGSAPAELPMSFDIRRAARQRSSYAIVPGLVADLVASGITAGDPTLWGADAEDEAGKRLGWTEAVASRGRSSPEIVALRDRTASRRASPTSSWPAWAARRSPPK